MSGLPTPHLLQVRRYSAGALDAHGNAVDTYGDPIPWPVAGVAPGAGVEASDAATGGSADHRDAVEIVWTVYAPESDATPTERDRVVVDGDEYTVEGRPQDWTIGPWPHPATGVVVRLTRKEG